MSEAIDINAVRALYAQRNHPDDRMADLVEQLAKANAELSELKRSAANPYPGRNG